MLDGVNRNPVCCRPFSSDEQGLAPLPPRNERGVNGVIAADPKPRLNVGIACQVPRLKWKLQVRTV
jgi:hypothetical protein